MREETCCHEGCGADAVTVKTYTVGGKQLTPVPLCQACADFVRGRMIPIYHPTAQIVIRPGESIQVESRRK